jgi:cyclophilin family peptidyl-prolyl cis-trans isomerase
MLFLSAAFLPAMEKMADGVYAEFTTPRGTFVVELNYRECPMTVASFVGLAEGTIAPRNGKPFFTGLKWYRVVPGFVIQSGDPDFETNATKDGNTGPYTFPDEFVPGLRHGTAGVLSMANAGPDTNGCEFFLTLGDDSRLNYLHSVFGHVFTGLEVLAKIQANDAFSIKILRVGEAGRAFKADEATFKALVAKAGKYAGTAEPGPAAHFDDPAKLLPVDPPRAKNFNFKLANYERVTGRKVIARLFAQGPSEAEDKVPGAYMHALAEKLGVARSGVLVAFFAPDDWRVWFGDEVTAVFLGRPVTPADLRPEAALHVAKEALINAALAKGDAAYAAQQKAAPVDKPVPPAQHLKLQVDALLDALMLRLEPAHHP